MGEEWAFILDEKEIEEKVPVTAKVGKRTVMLYKTGTKIYAVSGKCPHYGAPLHKGVARKGTVICPWHHARFDIETGRLIAPPALKDLEYYDVKVEKSKVWVRKAVRPKPEKAAGTENKLFAIVGAGAAGTACAVTLRREGFGGRVVLITKEDDLPYDRPNLSKDYLAGDAGPEWIPLGSPDYFKGLDIELMTKRSVTGIDIEKRAVRFEEGETLQYDGLLLCTGSIPRKPDMPGTDLEGFYLLRSFSDARRIRRKLEERSSGKSASVVLGASFIGLEVAQALRHRGVEVHVVAPDKVPMERVFGARVGEFLRELHARQEVVFHLGTTAKAIEGSGKVSGVVLADGEKIPADIVIAGIGVVPAVDFLEKAPLVSNSAVGVNTRLETVVKGIFAAGDIALITDPATGESRRVEHWAEAERQGQHAARSMMGSGAEYREAPFFWTKQYDTALRYVGYARQYDKIVYRGDVESGNFIAGYYNNGTLRAAAGIGRGKEMILLGELLREGTDVPEELLRDENRSL